MIRVAWPKGRNLSVVVAALEHAGFDCTGFDASSPRLCQAVPGARFEVLLLKDWDVPLYVERGVADWGVVGSDVLEETGSELLAPVRFRAGRSRLSLVGRPGSMPAPGEQVRLATKYPRIAAQVLEERAWSAEILPLSGSIELAPVLDLAEVALDIVQSGRTIAEHGLVELEAIREVAACLVVGRAAFHRRRDELNDLLLRLDAAREVE